MLDLEYDWHQIRIVMAEMIHFVRQIQAYCQLEVIACSWTVLTEFFQKREGDLDAMIEAHRTYLDRMVKKVLLLFPKAGKEVWTYFPGIAHVFTPCFFRRTSSPKSGMPFRQSYNSVRPP